MILKRKEKDNIIKAMYSSSNILASTYNTATNELVLIFNKGGQYKYDKVSSTDYTRFELSESQGKVFNSHIKKYAFEKLEDVNPELIVKEIEVMKNAEKKALIEGKQSKLVNKMQELINYTTKDSETQILNETQIKSLQDLLNDFVTVITTENTI